MKIISALVLFSVIGLAACYKSPDFSSEPFIQYVSVDKAQETDPISGRKKDNVRVTIYFEDREGDLGASAAEREDDAFKLPYGKTGNYELISVRKDENGALTEIIYSEDSVKWMPLLKQDNIRGPLKGKLDLNFTRHYGNSSVMIEEKYKIRIRDRALHYSNQVETDFITVPSYR